MGHILNLSTLDWNKHIYYRMCVIYIKDMGVHSSVQSRSFHNDPLYSSETQSFQRQTATTSGDVLHQAMMEIINRTKECSLPGGEHLRSVTFKP